MSTAEEKKQIRVFCDLNLRKKKMDSKFRELSRPARQQVKDAKLKMEAFMRTSGLTRATARCPETGTQVYLTLMPKVTHRRIDANIVGFGLEAFAQAVKNNAGDYQSFGSSHEMLERVIEELSGHITTQRRTEQEAFQFHAKKPKKLATEPFVDISSSIEPDIKRYSRQTSSIRKWQETKKKEIKLINDQLDAANPHVMRFLDTQGITSQRVSLGDASGDSNYFVRKKVSRTTKTLTNKDMKEIIRQAVRTAAAQHEFDTIDDVLRGDVLREAILQHMASRPKKEQVRLTLDKAGGGFAKQPSGGGMNSQAATVSAQAAAAHPLPESV